MPIPEGIQELPVATHIRNATLWELSAPLVLYLLDLAFLVEVYHDLAGDGLLLVNPLDHITCLHVHLDGVASVCDFVVQAFNLGEGCLQTVLLACQYCLPSAESMAETDPLRCILSTSLCDCDVVLKSAIIVP